MTLQYLVDTDWVIHWLNRNPEVMRRLEELQGDGVAIAMASLAELYEGVYYSTDPAGNERALNDFLRGVVILGIDQEICKVFGRERGRMRAAKKTIGDLDLLIASTALHHEVTLLTNNRRHFEMVNGLRIISL